MVIQSSLENIMYMIEFAGDMLQKIKIMSSHSKYVFQIIKAACNNDPGPKQKEKKQHPSRIESIVIVIAHFTLKPKANPS